MSATLPRVGDYLVHHGTHRPDSEAVVFHDRRFRYGEFSQLVDTAARAMLAQGVGRGDAIAVLSTPRPEYLMLHLAAARIGAIFVGLNPRHTRSELEYVVGDAKPALLYGLAQFEGRDFRSDLESVAKACSSIRNTIIFGAQGCDPAPLLAGAERVADAVFDAAQRAVSPDDALAIIYTSGSTGRRKGVVLTHRNFVSVYRQAAAVWSADPVRQINNYPIDHIGCLGDVATCNLIAGGTQVFMERFDPAASLALLEREQISVWGQEVAMFRRLVDEPSFLRTDFSSLQLIWWAGAAAPASLVAQLLTTGAPLSTCWGMSETCGAVTFVPPTRDTAALDATIGVPAPGVEIRIAAQNDELQVRGDCVMKEYLGQPDATAAAIDREGWLRTGDRAMQLKDGSLRLMGRLTDMYKSGGYNVSPREIEAVIESHPDVAQVAVVRAPDPEWQEVGHAFLVPHPGRALDLAAIERWCREQLANYKIPKKFWSLANLPLLPVGKVDRKWLEAQAAAWVARQQDDGGPV
ncbi:MAG: class I adenylate-forming enzyme family protein [Rhodospirillaceae bacterium]|nr:class I adenylate-forming enzyme family protein [Rhodospirillaceae bacterium]